MDQVVVATVTGGATASCWENWMKRTLPPIEAGWGWTRMPSISCWGWWSHRPEVDAQLCEAILAGECLTITLRYLATGFTFSALEYTFCVSQHNILNCYLDLQRHVWEPQEGIHESADDSGGVGGHSKEVWGKLELPTLSWFPKWQTHHHTVSTECWFPFIIITKGPTPLCLWR